MESQDQVIRSEVEQMMSTGKRVTNKEIAARLKAKGIKSKRGKPLKASSVQYYRTKSATKKTTKRVSSTTNVEQAITSLAALLPEQERINLGVRLLRA